MASRTGSVTGPLWLKDFHPGYFAFVMATGIVAVMARLLRFEALSWALFDIAMAAYPLLWGILLVRVAAFPQRVVADFASHDRGPTFLTIVAANGVLGSGFATFHILPGILPALFWFSLSLWVFMVYAFLGLETVRSTKPDLERGLSGAWLLFVVATESLSLLASLVAPSRTAAPTWVFVALAFYLLGAMLYVLLSALILLRWTFRPMTPTELGAAWWINVGAAAIATLAGSQLMMLATAHAQLPLSPRFMAPFTLLLWTMSTFWIPLLSVVSVWMAIKSGAQPYDPDLWSAVFPLGMYAVATFEYAAAAKLPFLSPIPPGMFWAAMLAWCLTFVAMCSSGPHPNRRM